MKLDSLFLQIFNMSVTASLVIVAVLFIRFLLTKAPKRFSYLLWFVVIFRLLSPITLEAPVGVITRAEVASDYELAEEPISFLGAAEAAYQLVGDVANGGIGIQHVRTTEHNEVTGNTIYVSTSWKDILILFSSYVWAGVMICMVIYNTLQFCKLRQKLIGAVPITDKSINIYLADHIQAPFVIGIIRPKIYLPSSLSEREREFIILHEQHHISRWDPLWKFLAFAALCLHWFNPLVWLAFHLYVKDMEMSCDEAVMERVSSDIRVEYSKSLLRFSVGNKVLFGTPLAFGESDTKARVKNVIRYKKPALWGCVVAIIVILTAGVLLITDPVQKQTTFFASEYQVDKLLYNTYKTQSSDTYFSLVNEFHKTMKYRISEYGFEMKMRNADEEEVWVCEDDFVPLEITKEELIKYMPDQKAWISQYKFSDITEAYIAKFRAMDSTFEMKDGFHILIQTENGDTMLGLGWENETENGAKVKALEWLDILEISWMKDSVDEDFFNRLLEHATGEQISTFSSYESEDIPGYLIIGFSSHSEDVPKHNDLITGPYGLLRPEHDMGFAVFQTNSEGTGYKLLDYHIYDNAVSDNGSQIYYAEHPAVASTDGIMSDTNTFDVVFCIDERVKTIVRVLDDGTEVTQPVEEGMNLLSWKDTKNSSRVKIYFLDENGEEVVPVPDVNDRIFSELEINREVQCYLEPLMYKGMTYKQFKNLTEMEAELYHANFYSAVIPSTSVNVIFNATGYDAESAMAILKESDLIIRLEGKLGDIFQEIPSELTIEEFSDKLVCNGIVPQYSIEQGAGTAYYVSNRYLKLWVDSNGDTKNDLLLEIALDDSGKITPNSNTWISW